MNDSDVLIDGSAPHLVPPGEYDAVVLWHQKVRLFNRSMVQFRFRLHSIGPYNGVELDGYTPLGPNGKAPPKGKLVQWFRTASGNLRANRDRVSFKAFKGQFLRVLVQTVDHDYQQRSLPATQHYSVVTQVIERIGPIQEGGER